jgi:aspartyl-tRNA(Asn)/glutamyl-tRNA(Gln) amidotransferase subunit A
MKASSQVPNVHWTLRDAASAIARGDHTPNDVLEAYLLRIEALEGSVQAWSHLDIQGARLQAEILTKEAKGGTLRGPLHGVPVGVKDEFHIRGMVTGMRNSRQPFNEPDDATCAARLRAAGAIILGKTSMPVDGKLPPTRNPWNLEHTAGGTSSGSGAAVGARMVPFAIGEQTAGSNLRPAAYCGVAGMKPTYGRISRFGCFPFTWSRDHVGLIGLTMADLAIVLNVIAGPDPLDPTTMADAPPPADLGLEGMAPPRIGVVRNFFPQQADDAMNHAVEQSETRLAGAGAVVSDLMLPSEFGLAWMAARLVDAEAAALNASRVVLEGRHPTLADRALELVPAVYYVQARRIRTWLTHKVREAMAGVDAILMPVATGAAPRGLESTGSATLLVPWSFLGFPAITINGGLSPDRLPLGLQFVAGPKDDHRLLRTGAWCEQVLGCLPAPPTTQSQSQQ